MSGVRFHCLLFLPVGLFGCASHTNGDGPNVNPSAEVVQSAIRSENGESQAMTSENATSALDFTVKDIVGDDVS